MSCSLPKLRFQKRANPTSFSDEDRMVVQSFIREFRGIKGIASQALSYPLLPVADRAALNWFSKNKSPYTQDLEKLRAYFPVSGLIALNFSYEWACTSGAFSLEGAPTLVRFLDWPFPKMGVLAMVAHEQEHHYYNITWPGALGVLQAVAPGRFAAAINQAPIQSHGLGFLGDWVKNRKALFKNQEMPPDHLLRYVFENASSYKEAKEMLSRTPICLPVIYTLTGTCPGEGCVIERTCDEAFIREGNNPACANHFEGKFLHTQWIPRPIESHQRSRILGENGEQLISKQKFDHIPYPVMNEKTRLGFVASAASGTFFCQGFEYASPVTENFIFNN